MSDKARGCGDKCKDKCGNCTLPGEDGLPVQCVGPWVEDKYSLLERYLDATRYARKKYSDKGNAVFVDLFAGPGRCIIKNERREIPNGAIRVVTERGVPFSEHYLIDICSTNVDVLKSRLHDRTDCHIVYMDPFGPEGLPFRTVDLFAKLAHVDLFIHFPIGAIRRNLPIWKEGEYGILDEMLGTAEWRERLDELREGKTLYTLLDIYLKQLLCAGFPEDVIKTAGSDQNVFSSLPAFAVKNTKDVELYALVLASKHEFAQKIWNSVLMVEPRGQRRFL